MKLSGETWVGNLYQKFEAVCHEVDGLVSQEHIKSLESHVQSVGDNVMKLCSNVKDLLPSSLGVPVEHKGKSVIGDVDSVTDAREILPGMDVTDSLRSDETQDQVSDEDLEEPSSSSSESPFGQSESSSVISEDHDEEKPSSEVSEQNNDSFTKVKQSPSCGSEVTHSGLVTKEDLEQAPEDMISENTDGNSTTSENLGSLVLSHHCDADFFSSKSRASNWSVIEIGTQEKAEDVESGSLASAGSKPKQMEFTVRFEGSCCVFVESDSIQGDSGRAPSRKKRLKGLFWRRKKVVEKEYMQLGIWYGDIDAELDEFSRQKLISPTHNNKNNNSKHLSSSSSREESGWELL